MKFLKRKQIIYFFVCTYVLQKINKKVCHKCPLVSVRLWKFKDGAPPFQKIKRNP